ncbi:immunoglobulin lambda-1 light chain-like [Girardinichthys multiradiatus]|uniref:immunoglobulin lambda-1 light chain-like n=1 Tax=Girardinichthys multiradiatus TaxID=208333 RepID=UPI001FAD2F4E|nr:immunoglobulin lambda-1 light chain-like [Girardinichthys multiradiatus]
MLGSLCTLITALTCVSGVTVVTQKHPVVTVRKGETATMDCNLGTVSNSAAQWYRQIPGEVPLYMLRFYHGWSSPSYGSGFSSPKFTSTHQSTSDYRLIINNIEEGDSAVYYCQTWDDSVKEYISQASAALLSVRPVCLSVGQNQTFTPQTDNMLGTLCSLITALTCSSLPPPVLTVFPPSSVELQSNKATLLCLSSQSGPFADVSWLVGGSPVSSGISTSTAVPTPEQTFQISSSLTIQTSDWNMNKVYTCKVSLGSQTAEKTINKSGCPGEE